MTVAPWRGSGGGLIRGQDSLAFVARIESAATTKPLVVTLRTDTTFIPRGVEVAGDEDATVTVLGKRTRVGTGSSARTLTTPTNFFVLPESPAVAPWGAMLRRWNRAGRPTGFSIPGQGDLQVTWRGRDSVLIGSRRMILERIECRGDRLGAPDNVDRHDRRSRRITRRPDEYVRVTRRVRGRHAVPARLGAERCPRLIRNASDNLDPTHTARFAIVGATVLDGIRDTPLRNAVILVEDGRIEQIGTRAKVKIPAGVATVQGKGFTVMPGMRAEGWSVSDLGWGPGALARGYIAVRLATQSDTTARLVRESLARNGGLAPRVLNGADTAKAATLSEGAPADFIVVQGLWRSIPRTPTRVRWVSLGGRLYSAQALRKAGG